MKAKRRKPKTDDVTCWRCKRPAKFDASKKTFMSVDPGLAGTGVAIWRESERSKMVLPVWCGVWSPGVGAARPVNERGRDLYNWLSLWYGVHHCEMVYVEEPQFEDSARGNAAARSGGLLKLSLAASVACSVAWSSGIGGHAEYVPINKWKGNLSKDLVISRIVKRFENAGHPNAAADLGITSHAWDAVGIGLFVKGLF